MSFFSGFIDWFKPSPSQNSNPPNNFGAGNTVVNPTYFGSPFDPNSYGRQASYNNNFGGIGTYQNQNTKPNSYLDDYDAKKPIVKTEKEVVPKNISDPISTLSPKELDYYSNLGKKWYSEALTQSVTTSAYSLAIKNIERQGGRKFVDEEFPPTIQSLVGENKGTRSSWSAFEWLRPEDFLSGVGQIQVFLDRVEPNDIRQGYLGDCYFLSAIASIAEWPERIKKLFQSNDPNFANMNETFEVARRFGCYFVNMCQRGEWKEVIVDDFIPCIDRSRGPAFTRAVGKELWVMLLEKAWAKVYNSYDNIEAGLTRECLHDLTGAPTKTIWTDEEQLWENILRGEKNQYPMTAGSGDFDEGQDQLNSVGIVGGHAYSLLAGYEIDYRGRKLKLVKLRNPWGDKEWAGPWSDNSNEWNTLDQQVKAKLMFDRKPNDGIFFMEFPDFIKYFTDCQFCLVNDNFKYVSVKAECTKKSGVFFRVIVKKPGRYYFTVNQNSKRKYSQAIQNSWQYGTATIVLAKHKEDGTFQYIEGKQKADREVWTAKGEEVEIAAGEYYIFVKLQWNRSEKDEFVLSSYGAGDVQLEQIPKFEAENFLSHVYMDHAKNISPNKKEFGKFKQPDAWCCVDQTDDGYAYLSAWNNGRSVMKAEFRMKRLGPAMKVKRPYLDGNIVWTLKPGEEKIALVRIKDYKQVTLSYSQMINFM